MFTIFSPACSGVRLASSGLPAVKAREAAGLPESTDGWITHVCSPISDRRAAEAWPEALNNCADLPSVSQEELDAMILAGAIVLDGPAKCKTYTGSEQVGVRLKLTCSPLELVCWRRAWAAEAKAKAAEAKAARLEERIAELEKRDEDDDSEDHDDDN